MEDEKKPKPEDSSSAVQRKHWPWIFAGMAFALWQLWQKIEDKDGIILTKTNENTKCYIEQRDEFKDHEQDSKELHALSDQLLQQNDSLRNLLYRRDSAGKDHMRHER